MSPPAVTRAFAALEEGLDAGIRIGQLPDSSMRALRVGLVRIIVCASPGYINRGGMLQKPGDIKPGDINEHEVIESRAGSLGRDWKFEKDGESRTIRIQPRLTVTSNDAAIQAAMEGFGITRLLSYQVTEYLASGELEILLQDFEPRPLPVHIVHREGRLASTRVRAFIDLMVKRLRKDKALNYAGASV